MQNWGHGHELFNYALRPVRTLGLMAPKSCILSNCFDAFRHTVNSILLGVTLLDAASQYGFPSSPQGRFLLVPVPLCRMPHGSHSGMHATPLSALASLSSSALQSAPAVSAYSRQNSAPPRHRLWTVCILPLVNCWRDPPKEVPPSRVQKYPVLLLG